MKRPGIRPARIAAVMALATMLLAAAPASAAPVVSTITVSSFFPDPVEPFTTTGGVLCDSGTALTDFDHFGGGPRAGPFHLTKTLTCDDGSGTFTIRVEAKVIFGAPTDNGGWAVMGGTGDYENLHGGGSIVGTYVFDPDGIIDVYTGIVMN